jgi:hypothetical protein
MTVDALLLLRIGAFAAVGLGLGAGHFLALRRNMALYLAHGCRGHAALLHVLRLMLVAGAWLALARFEALALIPAFAGFLGARYTVAARAARTA